MTLHEEIVAILKENKRPMTNKQIADKVNERKIYKKKDGSEISSFQIHGRTKNYPKLFYRDGNKVGLNEWLSSELKIEDKLSDIQKGMKKILEDNEDSLTTKEILSELLRRSFFSEVEKQTIKPGRIYLEARKSPDTFTIEGDEIGLVEWEELDEEAQLSLSSVLENIKEQIESKKKEKIFRPLKSVGLANFKPYNELQNFNFKPITLLFGPNSSGKSSLIHSLLYIQNSLSKNSFDFYRMSISGDSVDLGGFKQLIYKRDDTRNLSYEFIIDTKELPNEIQEIFSLAKELKIRIEIRQQLKERTRKKIIRSDDKQIYYNDVPSGEFYGVGAPKVQKYTLLTDEIEFFSFGSRETNIFKVNKINFDNPVLQKLIEALIFSKTLALQVSSEDKEIVLEGLDEIVNELYSTDKYIFPRQLKRTSISADDTVKPISQDKRRDDLINAVKLVLPNSFNTILGCVYDLLESEFAKFSYLGPVRSYPDRHLAYADAGDPNYFSGGAFAWENLKKDSDLLKRINSWFDSLEKLDTKYELQVRKSIDIDAGDTEAQLYAAAEEYDFQIEGLSELQGPDWFVEKIKEKLKEPGAIEGITELTLFDKNAKVAVSHRDVGFGISQVIPVLVSLFGNKNKIILIEQPEIHLHPALQAELGDVVIESALGENKNHLILENHSEHLMLRILRRIRENTEGKTKGNLPKITPDDVQVVYVKPSKEGAILHQIPITPDGDFAKRWPDGFFPERAEELFPDE